MYCQAFRHWLPGLAPFQGRFRSGPPGQCQARAPGFFLLCPVKFFSGQVKLCSDPSRSFRAFPDLGFFGLRAGFSGLPGSGAGLHRQGQTSGFRSDRAGPGQGPSSGLTGPDLQTGSGSGSGFVRQAGRQDRLLRDSRPGLRADQALFFFSPDQAQASATSRHQAFQVGPLTRLVVRLVRHFF